MTEKYSAAERTERDRKQDAFCRRVRKHELTELVVVSTLDGDEVEPALLDELRTLRADG